MIVEVVLFAQAREHAGAERLTLTLPEGSRVADARAQLAAMHPALSDLLPVTAFALDGELVRGDALLAHGVELALLPPVSGG